jgi:metal-responsive CopG/Arc/MetJ family transcriptional regulator
MGRQLVAERKRVRTTVDLSESLLQRTKQVLSLGVAQSRNALIEHALIEYLDNLDREKIDEEFAEMGHDQRYQALNVQIAKEFENAAWEAFKIAEGEL